MHNMGMHKMGQHQDIHLPKTLGGFMNPTMTYATGGMLQQDVVRKKHKKHAHKRHMKKHKLAGMGMKHMKKHKLAGMMMGMMGMMAAVKGGNRKPDHQKHKAHMGMAHKAHMGMMGHKLLTRGPWALVKKTNGQCECTKSPNGQIVIGRFHSSKECEDGRSHNC